MPMPMPMAPAPRAAQADGPMKTVMIGAGGDQEGFPIVGWLVPLNGQNAYQTWRLKPGLTKIGTAPPSDIVVNDGFMSTEHCRSRARRRASRCTMTGRPTAAMSTTARSRSMTSSITTSITLGKTNFKFKSIN